MSFNVSKNPPHFGAAAWLVKFLVIYSLSEIIIDFSPSQHSCIIGTNTQKHYSNYFRRNCLAKVHQCWERKSLAGTHVKNWHLKKELKSQSTHWAVIVRQDAKIEINLHLLLLFLLFDFKLKAYWAAAKMNGAAKFREREHKNEIAHNFSSKMVVILFSLAQSTK